MNSFKKVITGKKFKYGSVAMAFTAIFVALIVVINIITTAIHVRQPLMIDMTEEQIYTVSDVSKELLKDITAPLKIIFFQDVDRYEKADAAGRMIVNCAKNYTAEFPNITIEVIDAIKHPNAAKPYKSSEASNLPTTTIVIEGEFGSRVITKESMFTVSEETGAAFGFRGEVQFTSAILQVTSREAMPIVYFTTGHSENFRDMYNEFVETFVTYGYDVRQIDLSKEEIDPEATMMVILDPKKDFIGTTDPNSKERSEIDKLDDFLNNNERNEAGNYGNLFVFTAPGRPVLPELEELLRQYGIGFVHDSVVIDYDNSIFQPEVISVQYNITNTAGDNMHSNIRRMASLPKTVVPYAMPLDLIWGSGIPNGMTNAAAVLTTFSSAILTSDDDVQSGSGVHALVALAQRTRSIENNPKSTFVFVSGSTDFIAQKYLTSSFANKDIIANAINTIGTRRVPVDINFKPFDDNKITATAEQANNWSLLLSMALPGLVLVTGFIVYLRRRHS